MDEIPEVTVESLSFKSPISLKIGGIRIKLDKLITIAKEKGLDAYSCDESSKTIDTLYKSNYSKYIDSSMIEEIADANGKYFGIYELKDFTVYSAIFSSSNVTVKSKDDIQNFYEHNIIPIFTKSYDKKKLSMAYGNKSVYLTEMDVTCYNIEIILKRDKYVTFKFIFTFIFPGNIDIDSIKFNKIIKTKRTKEVR